MLSRCYNPGYHDKPLARIKRILLPTDDLRNLDSVKQFVACVERYCNLLENHQQYEIYPFLRELASALAALIHAVLNLPTTDDCSSDNLIERSMSTVPLIGLEEKFGRHRHYQKVFNPYEDDDALTGDLYDDLCDIYLDVGYGLAEYKNGSLTNICDAIWHWNFHFESHWGYHALGSLYAIYWLISRSHFGIKPELE